MTSPVDPSVALRVLTGATTRSADPDECAGLLGTVKQLRGWIDSFEAGVTSRLRELHATAGAAPAADLHTRCGGVSAAEGKRKERRSKTIDEAPSFGDALASGDVGAEHIDALAAATSKLDDDVKTALLGHEDDLLADATRMSPERFGRSCRDLARRLERDQGIERNTRQRRDTFLSRKLNGATGMVEGRFAFHPELANQVFGAVDREVAAMIKAGEGRGEPCFVERSIDRNQLAAEALGTLVGGGHQQIRPLEADITLIVDEQTVATGELHDHSVCETTDGAALPPASVRRLICNGRVTPVVVDQHGNPFDLGQTTRHANRHQRRALQTIYRCCGFAGCDVAFERCEIHHILPWELGGPSDLINLIPLCSRHHHVVHDGGWQLDLDADRTLTIRQPDGRVFAVTKPDVPVRPNGRRSSEPPVDPSAPPDRRRPAV
ncbi:MAG: DUF222 domain-containing protein [Ilumatobacteraceae bacterium]|nr:DUF222 domain-containing protein [Ilumatobacteraceae bacterium]